MRRGQDRRKQDPIDRTDLCPSFDEADWVDWDHWQTVEELQNFMNGLADETFAAESNAAGESGGNGQRGRIARQIHRHGLEIDW